MIITYLASNPANHHDANETRAQPPADHLTTHVAQAHFQLPRESCGVADDPAHATTRQCRSDSRDSKHPGKNPVGGWPSSKDVANGSSGGGIRTLPQYVPLPVFLFRHQLVRCLSGCHYFSVNVAEEPWGKGRPAAGPSPTRRECFTLRFGGEDATATATGYTVPQGSRIHREGAEVVRKRRGEGERRKWLDSIASAMVGIFSRR